MQSAAVKVLLPLLLATDWYQVYAVPPATDASKEIEVYFGCGCFWHVQKELASLELELDAQKSVTARVGYAGGSGGNVGDSVCYHNSKHDDYNDKGYAEVVRITVTFDTFAKFAGRFFELFVNGDRKDVQDRGPEYRSLVGIPGGTEGDLWAILEAKNDGGLELKKGSGADGDTSGKKIVWVMDSDKFPFKMGEKYHQFHDDMGEAYEEEYHRLKNAISISTKCPDEPSCEGAMPMCKVAPQFPTSSNLERAAVQLEGR